MLYGDELLQKIKASFSSIAEAYGQAGTSIA